MTAYLSSLGAHNACAKTVPFSHIVIPDIWVWMGTLRAIISVSEVPAYGSWSSVTSCVAVAIIFALAVLGQTSSLPLLRDQVPERSVALVLAGHAVGRPADSAGGAITIRENGILLVPYHVIKNAQVLQVRFRNGEVFDDVQVLGVDERRDIAAIKVAATGLSVLPTAAADQVTVGEAVTVVAPLNAVLGPCRTAGSRPIEWLTKSLALGPGTGFFSSQPLRPPVQAAGPWWTAVAESLGSS